MHPRQRIVFAAWLAQLFAIGLSLGAYPVFIASIEAEFGASRAQTSLGIPLVLLAAALAAPLLGKWVDRGSPRHVMTTGALLLSLGLWALSQLHSLPLMTGLWIGLVGLGQAMLGAIPANAVLATWFEERRALMVAIAGTGITTGSAVFPFIAEHLINTVGWRDALQVFAAACLLLATPVVWLCIARAPVDSDSAATAELEINFFGDWRYWVAGLALACMPAVLMTFNTHIVSWAEYRLFGREFGVAALSGAAVLVALSSLLFGQLCDRLGPINSLRLALLLELLGWSLLTSADDETLFIAGVVLLALGAGSFLPCQASLLAQLWPVQAFGRATGFVGLLVVLLVFIVPAAVGWGFEQTGGYDTPMRWVFAVLISAAGLLTFLQRKTAAAARPAL